MKETGEVLPINSPSSGKLITGVDLESAKTFCECSVPVAKTAPTTAGDALFAAENTLENRMVKNYGQLLPVKLDEFSTEHALKQSIIFIERSQLNQLAV